MYSEHVGLLRPRSVVVPPRGTGGTTVAQFRAFSPMAQARFLSLQASRSGRLCSGVLGVG